jgi:squalene-hopene/tetraprenyl-beta-curcumene cyclase
MRTALSIIIAAALLAGMSPWSFAAEPAPAQGASVSADAQNVIKRALDYLKSQQRPDGTWQRSPREPLALTALVLRAFARDPAIGPKADFVRKGFDSLIAHQQPDGGIYKDMLANYNTAIAVSALASANDPAYKPAIDKAVAYLKGVQFSDTIVGADGKPIDAAHPFHGGWGYGRGGPGGARPDLSNTNTVLEALKDSGLKSDDPAYQRAMKFISRMQNNSETNNLPWAGNDGGFIYGIDASGNGNSAAGEYRSADGKPLVRSYGSMTYGALKSMIYAGLTKDDPRVKAAWNWITSNWTLDENPGMRASGPENARDGLFYYYQTFGHAMAAYGQPTITDRNGNKHDWRVELIRAAKNAQRDDGSFVGERKWMEENPILSTTFAVLALQEALADLKRHPPQ